MFYFFTKIFLIILFLYKLFFMYVLINHKDINLLRNKKNQEMDNNNFFSELKICPFFAIANQNINWKRMV